jgi:hypothetical protein
LLRLMALEPHGKPSVMALFTGGQTPSVMDILLMGEETAGEDSIARRTLGTTFTIEDGRIRMVRTLWYSYIRCAEPSVISLYFRYALIQSVRLREIT